MNTITAKDKYMLYRSKRLAKSTIMNPKMIRTYYTKRTYKHRFIVSHFAKIKRIWNAYKNA